MGLAQTRLPEGEGQRDHQNHANQRVFHQVVQPHQVQAVIYNREEQHAAEGAGDADLTSRLKAVPIKTAAMASIR